MSGLLSLIEADRNGEAVDKALLKHLVQMFTSLGTYSGTFEQPFLETSTQYYSLEGRRCMQELDVADYLVHCEVRGSYLLLGLHLLHITEFSYIYVCVYRERR